MNVDKFRNDDNIDLKCISGAKLSHWGAGGLCSKVVFPHSIEELVILVEKLERCIILGKGSNTLISDKGIEEVIISTKYLEEIFLQGDLLYCCCGATLGNIYRIAYSYELSGMEQLSGIPGSIGGATIMNAGAFGRELSDLVEFVDVFDGKSMYRLYSSQLCFGYRHSCLADNQSIILGVGLRLTRACSEDIYKEHSRCVDLRKTTQPQQRSLGSVFKSYNGLPAATYIDRLNIKGFRIGGAIISNVHCNFIVNDGTATTGDYIALARTVKDKVYQQDKIVISTELKYIGERNEDFWRLSHSYNI